MTISIISFIWGYSNESYLWQDMGFCGTLMNGYYMIIYVILFRPLSASTKYAGVLSAGYGMFGTFATLIVNEAGGFLFVVHQMLPFVCFVLPFNLILTAVNSIDLFCC